MKDKNINDFYRMIGNKFKKTFSGYDAWVITSDKKALKSIDIKPAEKLTLYNGGLQCGFWKFELFEMPSKKIIKFR